MNETDAIQSVISQLHRGKAKYPAHKSPAQWRTLFTVWMDNSLHELDMPGERDATPEPVEALTKTAALCIRWLTEVADAPWTPPAEMADPGNVGDAQTD